MRYEISYNAAVAARVERYFSPEKPWESDPRSALQLSMSDQGDADSVLGLQDIASLSPWQFIQVLFSAMPRSRGFGGIVGWSKAYLSEVARRGDVHALVSLTNYVFKALCLDVNGLSALMSDRTLRVCQDLHYWANVEIHNIRTRDLQYYRVPITLDAALSDFAIDQTNHPVVFTFLTENYLDNLAIWLDMYKRHDSRGEHLIVMVVGNSASSRVFDLCCQKDADMTRVFEWNPPCKMTAAGNGMDLAFLWYVKVHVVSNFIRRGLRVVYSDLDAYWIKNFFDLWHDIRNSTNVDLIISPTFDMPSTAILNWTFAPCAGFFSVEPTAKAMELLGEWRRMTEVMYDDQIGLAELLFRKGIEWHLTEGSSVLLTGDAVMSSGRTASLAVLNPAVAKRVGNADPESIGDATIWHPRWIMNPAQHVAAISLLRNSQITGQA